FKSDQLERIGKFYVRRKGRNWKRYVIGEIGDHADHDLVPAVQSVTVSPLASACWSANLNVNPVVVFSVLALDWMAKVELKMGDEGSSGVGYVRSRNRASAPHVARSDCNIENTAAHEETSGTRRVTHIVDRRRQAVYKRPAITAHVYD